jgi:pentatricopeptide repeat protein
MILHWLAWPFRAIFALGLESSAHRLMESHEWREAREVYRRLIEWSPRQATFHTEAGLAHLMLNEWEPAEDRLREAVRLDPKAFRAYDLLGVLLANQGRLDEARRTWERMIAAGHSLAEGRARLFEGYARRRVQEAEERIATLEEPDFRGFPVDPGYDVYPGGSPGSVD